MQTDHTDECTMDADHACNCGLISRLDKVIAEELAKWKDLGVQDPSQVILPNPFLSDAKYAALVNLLAKKGFFTMDELEIEFKRQMGIELASSREGFVQHRRQQILSPKMVIPRGKLN